MAPPPKKWAPQTRVRFTGLVYRYIPHSGANPMDGTYSMRRGQRWNARGSFPVVYTNCTVEVAINNIWHQHKGESGRPWEVDSERQPDLYEIQMDQDGLVDIVTAVGVAAVGLPVEYPDGVPYSTTQPIGQLLYNEKRPGIWCRSAAQEDGEEIALFTDYCNSPHNVSPPKRFWEWFPVPEDWKPEGPDSRKA